MTCKETTGLGGKYMSFDCPKNVELYPAEKVFSTSFGPISGCSKLPGILLRFYSPNP